MTNYVKQKFQWFFDMATNTSACQRIDISAGGNDIYKRLTPFFGAFKHFKLGAVKIRMVPAATLPVDPTGLSYEAGENTVDPRDMFNPGLVRITNGEDIPPVSGIDEATYYATMLDKRWFKFRLQTGFRRTAVPLFWGVGQVRQDITPGSDWNMLYDKVVDGNHIQDMALFENSANTDAQGYFEYYQIYGPGSTDRALFQTGQKIRMGWLPTDAFQQFNNGEDDAYGLNPIPDVPLITIILPKAYKTKMYYRVFVEESVMFKDAVAINPYEVVGEGCVGPTDRYVVPQVWKTMGGARVPYNDPVAGGGFDGHN